MRNIALHTKILIGVALGLAFALLSIKLDWPGTWTGSYIKPLGVVFMNSLKMVAIPLIFVSLVVGITNIQDAGKLSRIGGKTLLIYTATTVLAVVIGLGITNLAKPGQRLSQQARERLLALYTDTATPHEITIHPRPAHGRGLQFLLDFVPENLIASMSNNENLLQVVLVAILLGIALLQVPPRKNRPVILFFLGINEALIELVRLIMNLAPVGVFALVASLLVEVAAHNNSGDILEILHVLLWYVLTVIGGLSLMTFLIYPVMISISTKMGYFRFLSGIYPAQLVAFTTSSSSATLSTTMESVEKNLGVSEEISSFLLPLGATINMDGTALYQGVAVVFIAQVLGIELSTTTQFVIVANIVITSLGVAGVPGGSMVTTMMLLQGLGIPAAGLSLILAPDRILDMCRTVTNVTGDAAVAVVIAKSEGELAIVERKSTY